MLEFLIFIAAVAIAYFVWRIADQLPDILFRIAEIQRDVAEVRRKLTENTADAASAPESAPESEAESA